MVRNLNYVDVVVAGGTDVDTMREGEGKVYIIVCTLSSFSTDTALSAREVSRVSQARGGDHLFFLLPTADQDGNAQGS